MINKKILIPILFSSVLLASFSFKSSADVCSADGTINFDVDKIQALSHKDGTTVNFVNYDISSYWNSDASDVENIKNLYESNTEIMSFAKNASNHEYVRNLYAKWDDFKPVNNTLTWKSSVKASSYDIKVALTSDFTETLYEEKGLNETSYTMENPYANTTYYWQVTAHTASGDIKSAIFDFKSGDYKRTVDIPSISNTRDVGGFTGQFGTMKQGLIYRSGRIDDVNDEGKEVLSSLNIQTDLDLREYGEGIANPANLNNYYLRTLKQYTNDLSPENRANTIECVKVFLNPNNYPVMFHCAVGRDRTGTLGMILQSLAGASREYIIHDYYTSMWLVTGAYEKALADLNIGIVTSTLDKIESYGNSLSSGIANFLRKDSSGVGLTDEEIGIIRDIWSGKIETPNTLKPFKSEDNYEGKAYVSIKGLSSKNVAMMVNKGSVVSAPYELTNSYGWFSDGELFDFTKPIEKTIYIYVDYVSTYVVVIHFIGLAKEDEILNVKLGDVISLLNYEVDGYEMLALLDSGKEISKIDVTRNAYINVIYTKK